MQVPVRVRVADATVPWLHPVIVDVSAAVVSLCHCNKSGRPSSCASLAGRVGAVSPPCAVPFPCVSSVGCLPRQPSPINRRASSEQRCEKKRVSEKDTPQIPTTMAERYVSNPSSEVEYTKKHIASISSLPGGVQYSHESAIPPEERERKVPHVQVGAIDRRHTSRTMRTHAHSADPLHLCSPSPHPHPHPHLRPLSPSPHALDTPPSLYYHSLLTHTGPRRTTTRDSLVQLELFSDGIVQRHRRPTERKVAQASPLLHHLVSPDRLDLGAQGPAPQRERYRRRPRGREAEVAVQREGDGRRASPQGV